MMHLSRLRSMGMVLSQHTAGACILAQQIVQGSHRMHDSTIRSAAGAGGSTSHSSRPPCCQSIHSNGPRQSFASHPSGQLSADAVSLRSVDINSSSGASQKVCLYAHAVACHAHDHASYLDRQCVQKTDSDESVCRTIRTRSSIFKSESSKRYVCSHHAEQ